MAVQLKNALRWRLVCISSKKPRRHPGDRRTADEASAPAHGDLPWRRAQPRPAKHLGKFAARPGYQAMYPVGRGTGGLQWAAIGRASRALVVPKPQCQDHEDAFRPTDPVERSSPAADHRGE
jgi:hypothetical protein